MPFDDCGCKRNNFIANNGHPVRHGGVVDVGKVGVGISQAHDEVTRFVCCQDGIRDPPSVRPTSDEEARTCLAVAKRTRICELESEFVNSSGDF